MKPLDYTESFPYLRRTVNYNNSDWAALYYNLRKANKIWGRVAKVLIHTWDHVKAREMMHKAVVKMVLLYGCEGWVMTDAMMLVLEGFHHRMAWRLAVLTEIRGDEGGWEWSPVATDLNVTGLWHMRKCLRNK